MNGVLAPLRHRDFRWLAAARTVEKLGNSFATIALAFAVLDLTGSVTDLGIVVGARSLANVALLLFGGVLADRFPRALVLQGSALLAGVSQAAVTASVFGGFASVGLLAGFGVANGAAAAASHPAAAALTPQTVPAEMLRQANSIVRIGMSGGRIVGASFGGLLVATLGSGAGLAADAASFLVVAGCFAAVRATDAVTAGHGNPFVEFREGFREFTARSWVWVVAVQFLIVNAAVVGGIQVLGPVVADETIGRTAWGLVLGAQMLGGVLGGVAAARWQPRRALRFGAALVLVDVLPLLALGYLPLVAVLVAAMFLRGVAVEQFAIAWEVSLQRHIPRDRLARVYSFDALGSFVAVPLGQLVAGPLATAVGSTATLVGAAALVAAATVGALLVPAVRNVTTGSVVSPALAVPDR